MKRCRRLSRISHRARRYTSNNTVAGRDQASIYGATSCDALICTALRQPWASISASLYMAIHVNGNVTLPVLGNIPWFIAFSATLSLSHDTIFSFTLGQRHLLR